MDKDIEKKQRFRIDAEKSDLITKRSKRHNLSKQDYINRCVERPEVLRESPEEVVFTAINDKHADEMEELMTNNDIKYRREGNDLIANITIESFETISSYTYTDLTSRPVKKNPTYVDIKEYIGNKYNSKVSNLDIAQMKHKYGIEVKASHMPKNKDSKVPICSSQHEEMIVDAFIYFGMITVQRSKEVRK